MRSRRARRLARRSSGRPGRLTYDELEHRIGIGRREPARTRRQAGRSRCASAPERAGVRGRVSRRASNRRGRRSAQRTAREARDRGALEISGASLLVDDEGSLESPSPPLDVVRRSENGDAAVVLFTSGTSGKPKGAILTHGGLAAAAGNAAGALRLGAGGRRPRRSAVLARARPRDRRRRDAPLRQRDRRRPALPGGGDARADDVGPGRRSCSASRRC